ncbi:uncharacterized protein METZ01_LOCUS238041, partial [marine metagenome]
CQLASVKDLKTGEQIRNYWPTHV